LIPIAAWGAKAGILIFLIFAFSPAVSEVGFVIAIICAMVKLAIKRDFKFNLKAFDLVIAFLFMVLILSSIFSIKPMHSVFQLKIMRFFALYYVIRYFDFDKDFIYKALIGFIASLSIISLYAVLQHNLGRELIPWFYKYYQWEGRIQPGIGQLALCAAMPCAAMLLWDKIDRVRIIFLGFCLALLTGAMYFSYARSVWIALGISGIALLWMRSVKVSLVALAMLVVAVGIFLVLPNTKIGGLLYSLNAPLDPANPRYGSNMERVRMARETVGIVKKRPILGLGFDSYRFYTQSPLKRISSDYLQFLANTGILGLFAYLCFLGVAMKKTIADMRDSDSKGRVIAVGVFGFLVAFTVCGAFEPMYFGTKTMRLLPLFLGLI